MGKNYSASMPRTARVFMFIFLLLGIAQPAFAQRVKTKLTQREVNNIKAEAKNVLDALERHLNFVSDPEQTAIDLDEGINSQFSGDTKIFYDRDFDVDDETDPAITKSGQALVKIDDYLRHFKNNYKQNKDVSIKFAVDQISDVKVGGRNLYIKVFYNEVFNGKSKDGKTYPKKIFRVAEMQVIQVKDQYKVYINGLSFADKAETGNDPSVSIIDAEDNSDVQVDASHGNEYYSLKLQQGIRAARDNNFPEAYYNLSEAKSGKQSAEAESQMRAMMAKMRSLNLDVNEVLSTGLTARARQLADHYRYDEAKQYYNYAKEVKPAISNTVAASIQAVNDKQQNQRQLYALLDKGSYQQAITGFNTEIARVKDNPDLYLGLARAYEQAGDYAGAYTQYLNAEKTDPSYPETYRQLAYFRKARKDYEKAYDAFATYQTKAEDATDPAINSELAFCRAMILYKKPDYSAALDSFRSSVSFNPRNTEALLYEAQVYKQQKDLRNARETIDNVLAIDEKYAEAHYVYAQILLAARDQGNSDNNSDKAIEEYKKAVKYNDKVYLWFFELGGLQMERGKYEDAIANFTIFINAPERTLLSKLALYKRGKCYFLLMNRDDEAFADYKKYVEVATTLQPSFYVDYGNLLIHRKNYAEAIKQFSNAGDNKDAYLGLGIANYLLNPIAEETYLNYFEKAFAMGVSKEAVKNDPNIQELYDKNKRFKSLMKNYKYHSLL